LLGPAGNHPRAQQHEHTGAKQEKNAPENHIICIVLTNFVCPITSNTCRFKKSNRIESVNPGLRQTAVDTQRNEGRQVLRFLKHEPAQRENDSQSSAQVQKTHVK